MVSVEPNAMTTQTYQVTVRVEVLEVSGTVLRQENIIKYADATSKREAKRIARENVKMLQYYRFVKVIDCRVYKQGRL